MQTPTQHQPFQSGTDQHQLSTAMQQCIENCLQCHALCMATVQYCLNKGGNYAQATVISPLLDCAEICETSANFMIRGSAQYASTCQACAAICEQCAKCCEGLGKEDALRACADACRKCAASCQSMGRA